MGKKNDLLNHYLEKAEIFAEFCNVAIYKGQRMILPQDLADAQRNYARMKRGRDGVLRSTVRERDVMKLLCRPIAIRYVGYRRNGSNSEAAVTGLPHESGVPAGFTGRIFSNRAAGPDRPAKAPGGQKGNGKISCRQSGTSQPH